MNTPNIPASGGARLRRLLPAILALLLGPALLPGAGQPAAPGAEPAKPYTLYLGADLAVEWHGQLRPVVGVQGNSFVIEADGRPVRVNDTDLRMKIDRVLKMTTAYATIAEEKGERAYTPANDPRHMVSDAVASADESAANVELGLYNLNSLQNTYNDEHSQAAQLRDKVPNYSVSQEDLTQASAGFQRSLDSVDRAGNSVPDAMLREQAELDRQLFDAFSLSCKISARQRLAEPFLVVVVRFREQPDNPKTARMLVYGQALPPIDGKPQSVRLYRGGLPRGYQLEGYQIHLYDRGTEIATSAAPKQMAMTAAEAFQFAVVDYATRNRDQTLPPAPARAFWPVDLAVRLPAKKLDRPLYLRVGRDGGVAGFFDDAGCSRPVSDAELEAVRPDLHFFPALAKGKMIESVVAFNLGQRVE